jgi:hypothetical protein
VEDSGAATTFPEGQIGIPASRGSSGQNWVSPSEIARQETDEPQHSREPRAAILRRSLLYRTLTRTVRASSNRPVRVLQKYAVTS